MSLDSQERVERLRQESRSDIPLGHRMKRFVEALQTRICREIERLEHAHGGTATFRQDQWTRVDSEGADGGGGLSRVIEDGVVIEKGGVNVSEVYGRLPEAAARALLARAGAEVRGKAQFFATGISLVLHPRNPFVPTVHANFRYFALGEGDSLDLFDPADQWFGGGADLTPYYPNLEDTRHFHTVWKRTCDDHPDVADYDAFKKWCDEYFYLPHRKEARGVGGIFFDHVRGARDGSRDMEGAFHFVRNAGRAFTGAYLPIAERRADTPYSDAERSFQALRRGRYAEFNLAYDRGTRFGLETDGRTESILMSLPPTVNWRYDWRPEPGTKEAKATWYFQPRDWLSNDVKPPD
ncbi:oxygen-dependent coproporphyrinogen oxidase [soil metagenome]